MAHGDVQRLLVLLASAAEVGLQNQATPRFMCVLARISGSTVIVSASASTRWA